MSKSESAVSSSRWSWRSTYQEEIARSYLCLKTLAGRRKGIASSAVADWRMSRLAGVVSHFALSDCI